MKPMVELGYHICICRCCDRSVRQEASGSGKAISEKAKLPFYTVANVIAHVVGWVVVAPVLDIVIYAEPANKVFAQGAFAAVSNTITGVVVGGLLILAYTKTIAKKGSLDQE